MNVPSALLWGFVATVALTTILSGSQWLGWTRMAIPFMLGTMVTPNRSRAMVAGSFMHVAMGWALATLYAVGFESLRAATWWLGALGGMLHALFVLLVIVPLLPYVHPRMATEDYGPTPARQLQPPGFLGLHYGRRTPFVTVIAHVVYGAIVGGFYELA
ncbi:MAG: hypothetical protein ACT443_02540 [Gemmatimonadota bacterium]